MWVIHRGGSFIVRIHSLVVVGVWSTGISSCIVVVSVHVVAVAHAYKNGEDCQGCYTPKDNEQYFYRT